MKSGSFSDKTNARRKGEHNYAEAGAKAVPEAAEDDVARVDIPIECHQICDTPTGLGESFPAPGEMENISTPGTLTRVG